MISSTHYQQNRTTEAIAKRGGGGGGGELPLYGVHAYRYVRGIIIERFSSEKGYRYSFDHFGLMVGTSYFVYEEPFFFSFNIGKFVEGPVKC